MEDGAICNGGVADSRPLVSLLDPVDADVLGKICFRFPFSPIYLFSFSTLIVRSSFVPRFLPFSLTRLLLLGDHG